MPRFLQLLGATAGLALLTANLPASAAPRTYTYSIENATYGVIGTYTDTIDESGGNRRIDTRLRVAIKVLGFVVYREEADRTELWHGGRLMSFHGLTTVDGKPTEVRGVAQGDEFVITSPSGTFIAPPSIYTSTPWSVELPKPDVMMSTKDGRVEHAQVIDDGVAMTRVNGSEILLRHYRILSNKRQDAWLDVGGVPVHFRSEEHGSTVDFILKPECFSAMIASWH